MATTETPGSRATAIEASGGCPECGGVVRADGGERVCDGCGLVVDVYWLDHGYEPRSFDEDDERERTGAPLTVARHDRGLSTEIGRGVDGNGNRLSTRKRRTVGRLRREHGRARWRSKAERNLADGLGQVKRLAGALDLPNSIRDRAAVLFREAHDAGLLRGRSIDGIVAASVYAACRDVGVLRTAGEVADASGTDEAGVRHDYSVLNIELGLAALPFPAVQYASRFASDLGVNADVRARAVDRSREADRAGVTTGTRPSATAGAACYLAAREAGLGLSQREVAAVAGTTDTTLRARCRDLEELDEEERGIE